MSTKLTRCTNFQGNPMRSWNDEKVVWYSRRILSSLLPHEHLLSLSCQWPLFIKFSGGSISTSCHKDFEIMITSGKKKADDGTEREAKRWEKKGIRHQGVLPVDKFAQTWMKRAIIKRRHKRKQLDLMPWDWVIHVEKKDEAVSSRKVFFNLQGILWVHQLGKWKRKLLARLMIECEAILVRYS